ncbi:MAG: hypothetical protein M1822_007362 [Bathelium mastoideum]|nr:MAG: hypothetical protein M1822_007362 [Bathelium mastoideum]
MNDEKTHPLLAQVPLAVSPYIHLPTAPTLPYTYKSLPSTLPPSVLEPQPQSQSQSQDPTAHPFKPAYVVSSGGAAAHPSDIVANCRALQQHLDQLQQDAEQELAAWERELRERELAEKRRVAPGWLDSEQRLLEPTRVQGANAAADALGAVGAGGEGGQGGQVQGVRQQQQQGSSREGEELDRAFGGMQIK